MFYHQQTPPSFLATLEDAVFDDCMRTREKEDAPSTSGPIGRFSVHVVYPPEHYHYSDHRYVLRVPRRYLNPSPCDRTYLSGVDDFNYVVTVVTCPMSVGVTTKPLLHVSYPRTPCRPLDLGSRTQKCLT